MFLDLTRMYLVCVQMYQDTAQHFAPKLVQLLTHHKLLIYSTIIMIYLVLAEGFEEIEAVCVLDILRRANLEVKAASLTNTRTVTGAHGIAITADTAFRKQELETGEMLILPGGMPGAKHLAAHEGLRKCLLTHQVEGKTCAAICAAPMVLGKHGLLHGKRATCYPGFENELHGATIENAAVVVDRHVITAQGPAAAPEFALAIVAHFLGQAKADEIRTAMLLQRP